MARAARTGPALIRQHDYRHIIDWYRDALAAAPPPPAARWEPIRIGPTWDWTPERGWLLPEQSMGWEVLGWCGYWLRDQRGQDWQFTLEQARFALHYESLDEAGRLNYRTAVLQRLKGWGKDPFAAAFSAAKAFGPTIFDHFDDNGDPVGREDHAAWVQIVAVAKEQTANTMKLFPIMLGPECRQHYGIQIGRENVWGCGDTRQIQATASNFLAVEGKRVTLAIRNECQNWNSSNQGHELAGAVDGNASKIEDGLGRILDIENAYRPGTDSVAERVRDAWADTQATAERDAKALGFGLLYDSLEAAADAPLTADAAPEVLESVRGDSIWLDIPTMVQSILNGTNTPSESRRKWYNQIVATADAWTTPQEFDRGYRDEEPQPGDAIVIFGDGSKSDDHTAAVGCRLSDGLTFPIGIWLPSKAKIGRKDVIIPVDRAQVDHDLRAALDRFDVHGFWFDPSDARDDETGERFWEPYLDAIARDYGRSLRRLPAVKTGTATHPVIWDMRNSQNTKTFTEACERALTDVVDGTLLHNCPQPSVGGQGVRMRQHVLNARRRPNRYGISIGKEHRESRRKIDAAVCMIGARMMRNQILARPTTGRAPGRGRVVTLN